jgi:hypothetical protein
VGIGLVVAVLMSSIWFSVYFTSSIRAKAHGPAAPQTAYTPAYYEAPAYLVGAGPRSVTIADFDSDGKPDLAATFSDATSGFSILRNLGSGRFGPKTDFVPPNVFPQAAYSRDLDGDGKPDLILSHSLDNKISIFRNTSTGAGNINFEPESSYTSGGSAASSIAFADFDGDGKSDLGVANNASSSVSFFRNVSIAGSITFAPRLDLTVSQSRSLAVGDFDGDGRSDLAVSGISDIRILVNASTGPGNITFSTSAGFSMSSNGARMVAADLNGDGKVDLASTQLGTTAVVLVNTSTGPANINFATRVTFATGSGPRDIGVADFNSDGKPDLVTSDANGNSVGVLINNTVDSANLSFAPRKWDFGTGILPYLLAVGDLNGDGKPDIAVPNSTPGTGTVSVLLNLGEAEGTTNFAARRDVLTPLGTSITVAVPVDFDGDGNTDIVAGILRNTVYSVSIFPNDGSGKFATRLDFTTLQSATITGVNPFYFAAADFDQDGKTDLGVVGKWSTIPASGSHTGLIILRNASTGAGNFAFEVPAPIEEFANSRRIFAGDLNGDGRPDLLATTADDTTTETPRLYRNTGSGLGSFSFSAPVIGGPIDRDSPVLFSDINVDGKIDVGYQTFADDLGVLVNTSPNGGALSFTQVSTGILADNAVLEDLDGDGKDDLVTGGTVRVARNTSNAGTLSFADPVVLADALNYPLVAADLTGDGKPDILSRQFDGSISVAVNASPGAGVFSAHSGSQFPIAGNINGGSQNSIAVADFDHDGKQDVFSTFNAPTATGSGVISVLLNRPTPASGSNKKFDFDGDGRADISVFRPANGTWYLLRSASGFTHTSFGVSTDRLAPADLDGDGVTDITVFRDGAWYWLNSSNNAFRAVAFGQAGDLPVPGDFSGDGRAELAVFRSGLWYTLDLASNQFNAVNFGVSADKPVPEDFDGDGRTDYAVYRDGIWYLLESSQGFVGVQFGLATDRPVVADYDGDGKADPSVYRAGTWYVLGSAQGFTATNFGLAADVPAPADYNGDGQADMTVFRDGFWYQLLTNQGFAATQFGATNDRPVPAAFIP